MAAQESSKSSEGYPMKGGDGPNSYAKNSTFQRGAINSAKEFINKAIAEKLDLDILSSSSDTFHIVDLGCSVGSNTFIAVENILEAVESKYKSQGMNSQILEFQVFFNDHTSNDFNTLFKSLPPKRTYYAMGVPGSFYGRLFPKASIHFVHSSYCLHWLSKVPEAVLDKNGLAWNKGQVNYQNSTDEVVRAYEAQYAEDMECFLHARAQEIVYGGLMVLTIPGIPDGISHSHTLSNATYQILASCLMDMVRKGTVSEEKVDSFNIPMYHMSPLELEAAVERSGCFSIERMENLSDSISYGSLSDAQVAQLSTSSIRAAMEGVIKQHFGDEILDELFDLFHKKFEEKLSMFKLGKAIVFLVVLKRKAN